MTTEVIKVTRDTVTLFTDTPRNVGTKIDLEVRLPEGMLLKSFALKGTISGCEFLSKNGLSGYLLEMKIGEISPLNQKILDAYIDFLEREGMLKEISVDFQALQEVFDDFGRRVTQLRETAEEVRNNIRGTLELVKRNAQGKTTIH